MVPAVCEDVLLGSNLDWKRKSMTYTRTKLSKWINVLEIEKKYPVDMFESKITGMYVRMVAGL